MPPIDRFRRFPLAAVVAFVSAGPGTLAAQTQANPVATYFATQVDREEMLRIPMRDGKRLNGSVFFPKNRPRQNLPTILTFYPYLINPASAENQRFLENGYALAYVNVRGRYFSEGVYTYLGGSGPDSYDTIDWLSKQPRSNGRVEALGCSSSAEEQHKMNAMYHPAFAAAVPRRRAGRGPASAGSGPTTKWATTEPSSISWSGSGIGYRN